jgi:hypothetical protein
MTKSTRLNRLIDSHNSIIGLAHRHCAGDVVPCRISIKRVGKCSHGENIALERVYNGCIG